MLNARTKWNLKEQPPKEQIEALMEETGFSSMFTTLCIQRNLTSKNEIQKFLNPTADWYHPPFQLGEMEKAVQRLHQAIEENEKITVYGDYDADGVTSTAILVKALQELGANVDYFIPNRFVHGYGPNNEAFNQLIEEGTSLILTCDNGIAGFEAIEMAYKKGIPVIVTDHHEIPEKLPKAYALVHPRLPGKEYPFHDLSGAGVAFKMAWALLGEKPTHLLGLAAIGTIADLVSLTDENRIIALEGIQELQKNQSIGLKTLLESAEVHPKTLNEDSVGFSIGPRLNAAGRLGDAGPAVELMLTNDSSSAEELAAHLNFLNEERKELVSRITEEALEEVKKLPNEPMIHILAKENWHEGVLGIVASKIVQETGRPAILLTVDEDSNLAKGSGRSIEKINLFELINQFKHLTTSFGGHQMAAGVSIERDKLEEFTIQINNYLKNNYSEEELIDQTSVDYYGKTTDISLKSIEEMHQLGPFGTDNPKPIFLIKEAMPENLRQIGSDKQHVKFILSQENQPVDCIGFNFPAVNESIGTNGLISTVGTLEINEWRNNRKPQLNVIDLKTEGTQYFDLRSKHFRQEVFQQEKTDYVFFKANLMEKIEQIVPESSKVQLFDESGKESFHSSNSQVIVVDCPPSMHTFNEFIQSTNYGAYHLYLYSQEDVYLNGLPERDDFSRLYKFILNHRDIEIRRKGKMLAEFLNINPFILNFMISVFFEAGFVTIDNGLMNPVKNPDKVNLSKTSVYMRRQELMDVQEKLHYSSFQELVELLTNWKKSLPVA